MPKNSSITFIITGEIPVSDGFLGVQIGEAAAKLSEIVASLQKIGSAKANCKMATPYEFTID